MKLLDEHFEINVETPDGIGKLRKLILTLAMQGRLVPQDPDDEPASELLKEIKAEKERLVKEGKIKEQKPLPLIKEEEMPFQLPKGWEWARLGQIGQTNIGLTYSPSDLSEVGTPVLRSNNVQNGKLDLSDLIRVTTEVKNSALVNEGDLLICARNGSRALVGKTALIKCLTEKMAFGAFMAVFRSRVNDYLLYFINSPLFRKMIDEVNTMTINQITQGNLKQTILPLPPIAEQKRIVTKIDQLMSLCDKLEAEGNERDKKRLSMHSAAMNRLLTAPDKPGFNKSWSFITKHFDELYSVPENVADLKKSILQLAVMGKLVPQDPNDQPASELLEEIEAEKKRLVKEGKIKPQKPLPPIKEEEIPYLLPKGWKWVRLGEVIVDAMTGLDRGRAFQSYSYQYPYFKMNNITGQGSCDFAEVTRINYDGGDFEKYLLEDGDFLFNTRNSHELVGKTCVFERPTDERWFFNNNILRIRFFAGISNLFVNLWLVSASGRLELEKLKSSTTNVAAIYQGKLISCLLPVPPVKEQAHIVSKCSQLRTKCDNVSKPLGLINEKRAAILDAVLARV